MGQRARTRAEGRGHGEAVKLARRSFNHPVVARKQRWRKIKAERVAGLDVNDKIKLRELQRSKSLRPGDPLRPY
jgi:hypothetical protein